MFCHDLSSGDYQGCSRLAGFLTGRWNDLRVSRVVLLSSLLTSYWCGQTPFSSAESLDNARAVHSWTGPCFSSQAEIWKGMGGPSVVQANYMQHACFCWTCCSCCILAWRQQCRAEPSSTERAARGKWFWFHQNILQGTPTVKESWMGIQRVHLENMRFRACEVNLIKHVCFSFFICFLFCSDVCHWVPMIDPPFLEIQQNMLHNVFTCLHRVVCCGMPYVDRR